MMAKLKSSPDLIAAPGQSERNADVADGGVASSIEIRGLSKSFGHHEVLRNVCLDVAPGELVALLGPSGGGKTTLLRAIAGFVQPTSGRICIGQRDVTFLPAHRRRVGVVFQNYALFPHMTVHQNIGFGLRVARRPRAVARGRVDELLALVGLQDHGEKPPRQLSGGQQQRVALARALAIDPTVLLLDEPLSALDPSLRRSVGRDLKAIQRSAGISTVMVTHDRDEAFAMADRIAVIEAGVIVQDDLPAQLYRQPVSRFVAELLGPANFITGEVTGQSERDVRVRCGEAVVVARRTAARHGRVDVLVRPEDIALEPASGAQSSPETHNRLTMTVAEVAFYGDHADVSLETEGTGLTLRAKVPSREAAGIRLGAVVQARWAHDAAYVL